MYKKYEITDAADNKIALKVYPEQNNLLVTDAFDIALTLQGSIYLDQLISAVHNFMSSNTINKIEVTEIED